MDEPAGNTTEPLTHGCMECKAQRPYSVETLPNRNTIWRCAACSHVVNLIPGKYREQDGLGATEVPA